MVKPTMRKYRVLLAPGTPLREGLDRIVHGHTGALIVCGNSAKLKSLCKGGFDIDAPFTPTGLRELAKMDGAVVLSQDLERIHGAGIHLMPDTEGETVETGTRHRSADLVSRQTGLPVITVSASMSTIALYLDGGRHEVRRTELLLTLATQAIGTVAQYRDRLRITMAHLSALEVADQVSVQEVVAAAQQWEMLRRIEREAADYVAELGVEGRMLGLQLTDLRSGLDDIPGLLGADYAAADVALSWTRLSQLTAAALFDTHEVATALGFTNSSDHLACRGYRQLAQVPRLPGYLRERLVTTFSNLQGLLAASVQDLAAVEGVGMSRARAIRDYMTRAYERVDPTTLG